MSRYGVNYYDPAAAIHTTLIAEHISNAVLSREFVK